MTSFSKSAIQSKDKIACRGEDKGNCLESVKPTLPMMVISMEFIRYNLGLLTDFFNLPLTTNIIDLLNVEVGVQ